MIVVDLECAQAHHFEGWFASVEAFAQQSAQQMVCCPVCGTHLVQRRPSAPHVARSVSAPQTKSSPEPDQMVARIIDLLHQQALTSEDVGARFAEEARKIHHGDAEERAIRGQSSLLEALELLEEGINVLPLPPNKEDLH